MNHILLLGSLALCSVSSAQQTQVSPSDAFGPFGLHCATPPQALRPAGSSRLVPSDCGNGQTVIKSSNNPSNGIVYEIPVVFHVIENTNQVGRLPTSRLTSQIDILNEDFSAMGGTPGAGGTDVRIIFYLATVDPNGNPTNGIDRQTNNTWFADNGQYWNTLAWDPNRYLNIYTNQASGALGYVPGLPANGIVGASFDRVVALYSAVGRNAPAVPYDQGRTVTHEVGHYLGLEHTFSGGCATSNQPGCFTSGDLICDTNSETQPVFGCPGNSNSCGNSDPYRNYMDYSDDMCMTNFTPNQANRMRCTMAEWRVNLNTPQTTTTCDTFAESSVRNAAPNLNVLTATAPIMGQTLTFTIANGIYDRSRIVIRTAAANIVLAGGQVALVNLSSGELANFGPFLNANNTINITVPNKVSLCGMNIYAQGLLLGGQPAFALTNAVDMVVGDM